MKKLKNNKWLAFGFPVVYILLGVVLLITSGEALSVIGYVAAAVAAAVGTYRLVSYLLRPAEQNLENNDFSIGLVMLVLSAVALLRNREIVALIPTALAFLIALNGVRELQSAVDAYRLHFKNRWIVPAVAAVNLIGGVVLMLDLPDTFNLLLALGIGLTVSGAADLTIAIAVAIKSRQIAKEKAKAAEPEKAAEARPEEAQEETPQDPPEDAAGSD